MTTIKQYDPDQLMRLATYASVFTASVLIAAKVIAWYMTDSISILATLVDSGLDVFASLFNLFAVRQALQPADKEHRFGHGKAEALAGMGQALLIIGSALFLFFYASKRLFSAESAIEGINLGIGVMLFSIVATSILIIFQNFVVKQTNSTAIKADALHYKTDLFVNISVIVALILAFYGFGHFDAVFAMGIAVFIVYSAWEIIKESLDLLMDHELPDSERAKITAVVLQHKDTLGLHDLRTRQSGKVIFIQFHLELDGALSLSIAHAIAEEIEQQLMTLFPNSEVIIHQDPVTVT